MAMHVTWGDHVWQGIDTSISRTVIILGSGVGSAKAHKEHLAPDWESKSNTFPFSHFGITVPAIVGHEGSVTFTTWDGMPVALFNGRAHLYQAIAKQDFHSLRYLIALIEKAAGPKGRVVLSNTCGGLSDDVPEGSIALPTGILSLFQSSLSAYYLQGWSGEFVSPESVLPQPGSKFHEVVKEAAASAEMVLNPDVVYVAVSGPQYETRVDIMFLRVFAAVANILRRVLGVLGIRWMCEELAVLAKMKTVGMSLLAELNLLAVINKDRARIKEKIRRGEELEQWEKESPLEPLDVGAINFISNNEAKKRTEALSHDDVLRRGLEYQKKFGDLISYIVSVDW